MMVSKTRQYLPVAAGLVCLVLLLTAGGVGSSQEPMDAVRFFDGVQTQALVPYWDEAEDLYYLFLPACTQPENVSVSAEQNVSICLSGGDSVTSLGQIPAGKAVELVIVRGSAEERCRLRIERCENLPALFIDMQSGGIEWLNGEKGRKQSVYARFVDASGSLMYQNAAEISGRGNGSWRDGEKKPYNLSFSSPVSMGPFENVTTLCMMADYSDESRMRNALAFHLGRQLQIPYASAYMQTDVYVNGEYMGIYGICTKQEYTHHITEDQIQAVFEITTNPDAKDFRTNESRQMVRVMYGNVNEVEKTVNRLEQALSQQDWSSCQQLLDLNSFAEKYVLDEFMGNVDMCNASQYFFIGPDGKIRNMLPWDYDWSIGSAINFFNREHAYGLMTTRASWYWANTLLKFDGFLHAVNEVLETEYSDAFLSKLQADTLALEDRIESSRECDRLRWKNSEPYCRGVSGFDSLSDLTLFFNDYYIQRRDHLLSYFSNPQEYCLVEFDYEWTGFYLNYLVPRGGKLSDYLQDHSKLFQVRDGWQVLGWHTDDGVPLDQVDTVTRDMVLHPELIPLEGASDPEPEGETLAEKLLARKAELAVLTLFGLSALVLFAAQLLHLHRRERGKA